ncbi:hypothetical protein LBBP_04424 [Leptospira borgpetersenii serovar Ballum]|uniref:Uncharacterized protein n=1 Tax=Leptospira borgpetersenii serovar Ballum TaxID=280505 RepID=A0A0S2IXZ1_LEPBO|nr:hypothetical protein LBBP_04424 [Leptospira borgpetersenii serovar Ballum]
MIQNLVRGNFIFKDRINLLLSFPGEGKVFCLQSFIQN